MTSLTEAPQWTKTPSSKVRWVLLAALACFCSTCWSFTRALEQGRLVDVSPGRTVLPLLLFGLVAFAGRNHPRQARRVVGALAAVIVVLTAIVLPIAMNRAIDAGGLSGAWPLDWLVPVRLHFRQG